MKELALLAGPVPRGPEQGRAVGQEGECRVAPGSVEGCSEGRAERWARSKQAPKTRRASEVVALTTRRKLDGFVARAADRRSPNAGPDRGDAVWLGEKGGTEMRGELKDTGWRVSAGRVSQRGHTRIHRGRRSMGEMEAMGGR